MTVTVWVFEDALSRHRRGLQVGDQLQANVQPAGEDLRQLFARCGLRPAWVADLDWATDACRVGQVRGRHDRIDAVNTRYRQQSGSWTPAAGTARVRQVDSTSAPDPARSVWPPSGSPVLIGFVLTLTGPSLDRHSRWWYRRRTVHGADGLSPQVLSAVRWSRLGKRLQRTLPRHCHGPTQVANCSQPIQRAGTLSEPPGAQPHAP